MKIAVLAVLMSFEALAQAPVAPGCSKDTDCKGERVCNDGRCVEPVVAAPVAPAPKPVEAVAATPETPAVESSSGWTGSASILGGVLAANTGHYDVAALELHAEAGAHLGSQFSVIGFANGALGFGPNRLCANIFDVPVSCSGSTQLLSAGVGAKLGSPFSVSVGAGPAFLNMNGGTFSDTTWNPMSHTAVGWTVMAHATVPVWRLVGVDIQASATVIDGAFLLGVGVGGGVWK